MEMGLNSGIFIIATDMCVDVAPSPSCNQPLGPNRITPVKYPWACSTPTTCLGPSTLILNAINGLTGYARTLDYRNVEVMGYPQASGEMGGGVCSSKDQPQWSSSPTPIHSGQPPFSFQPCAIVSRSAEKFSAQQMCAETNVVNNCVFGFSKVLLQRFGDSPPFFAGWPEQH